MLPKNLRDLIWRTYRPGQEITKTPSPDYIHAAQKVQAWIVANYPDYDPKARPPGEDFHDD